MSKTKKTKSKSDSGRNHFNSTLVIRVMLPEDYSPSIKINGNPEKSSKFLEFVLRIKGYYCEHALPETFLKA